MKHPKDNIEGLIKIGQLEDALQYWRQNVEDDDPLKSEITALIAQLEHLNADRRHGILLLEEELKIRNAITWNTLDLLKKWSPGGNIAPLIAAIQGLREEDLQMGAFHLVNCNRIKPAKNFRRAFSSRKETVHFQYYFLCGCPNEMPGSFAKRAIYSIIKDQLDGREKGISYDFREGADRIRINDLPLGDDLETSIKRFKAYVANRFRFTDTQSFDAFIETGVPRLEEDFVTAIFDVSERKWDGDEGEILAYFRWMMETFNNPNPAVPTFLFFIVVRSENFWMEARRSKRQNDILEDLTKLCGQYADKATVISDFPPVELADFSDWLAELDLRNPKLTEPTINALTRSLSPKDRELFDREGLIHMKDIEIVQKMIYEIASK